MATNTLRAVLFDLDDTLLDNNMDTFLPPYFKSVSARISHILPAKEFVAQLMAATQIMAENDGRATNEEVFAEAFYPRIGRSREELEPIFMDFYENDFPALQKVTRPRPEARRVVQAALDLNYDVVIATNPLFPALAVQHRLRWAGIDDLPFRLVTSYENSRACKPNLQYYRDILETIDRPADACLMVGDDPGDMVAARLGCLTYYVGKPDVQLDPSIPEPTYRGTLAGVERVLRELRPD